MSELQVELPETVSKVISLGLSFSNLGLRAPILLLLPTSVLLINVSLYKPVNISLSIKITFLTF